MQTHSNILRCMANELALARFHPAFWFMGLAGAYVLLTPNIALVSGLSSHDGQRIAQLALLGGIVILSLLLREARTAAINTWTALPIFARASLYLAFALGIVSAMQSSLPRWAMLEWAMMLLLLVLVMAVASGRRMNALIVDRFLVIVLVATAAVYATKVAIIYIAMLTAGAKYGSIFNIRDLYPGFSNIRFFGPVQTILLPFLCLPAMWWAKNTRQKALLGVVPAFWWMLVVASGARGAWVALAVGTLLACAIGGRIGLRWAKWQALGLICGLIGYAIFLVLVPNLLDQTEFAMRRVGDLTSVSRRTDLWASAISMAVEHPLLGVGPMHFAYHINPDAAHPHNAILQLAAECGLPATIIFVAPMILGGISFCRRAQKLAAESDPYVGFTAIALGAALAGAAIHAMVDGILVMPVSQVLVALICGWSIGLHFPRESLEYSGGRLEKLLCSGLIALASTCLIQGVQSDIGRLAQREFDYYIKQPPGTTFKPRFWGHGWIGAT